MRQRERKGILGSVFWAMQDLERDRKKRKIEEIEVCEERGLGVREKRREREGKKEK